MTYVPLCDTDGCDQTATNNTFGGFHFCDLHQNDKAGRKDRVQPITLRLPVDTHERLRVQAFENRTTITALILRALEAPGMDWRDAATLEAGARCAQAQAAPAVATRLYELALQAEGKTRP